MGQEESRVIEADAPPRTLQERTLEALAQYIKDGRAQKIVVMVGWSDELSKHVLIRQRQAQE
ncbi:NAD-dependent deacetylase sirtuin-2 [Pyrenophora tritici-repentis]|uniref:Uncharacterized protein n=1 Tax=Pyrenophora tritici-repentis TaxID=45151 RepID=A0A317A0E2_9PLEO|nr:NAD-dependent deacetylase sirtuin-2 [Pyrenophora tritici-repentis]KAF7578456.1 hypothetical protein PtrM4_026960 [Pyrenophora tritici-repentis]KAI1551085.1 NAD-dependent deacetylase sirtuin-2 [Pyrenophora tritici-repentis]KAI1576084.1 NAD-dependent deacetylase sirtuin-2 [Pyrenophora tritici-repentis]KAI1606280.1 NAD-dependent deacetylase sirtuin-2 [Pyrenophora tritici-repentis]